MTLKIDGKLVTSPVWIAAYQGALEEGQSEEAARAFADTDWPRVRLLTNIAAEIRQAWPNVYFGAKPYLAAMHALTSIDDAYGADDARSIVLYFLSNATSWKGETARRVKAELKAMAGI